MGTKSPPPPMPAPAASEPRISTKAVDEMSCAVPGIPFDVSSAVCEKIVLIGLSACEVLSIRTSQPPRPIWS